MKVLIADDQESVRSALRCALEQEGNICVVGEIDGSESLIAHLEATRPHLLIIDWQLFNGDANAALESLRKRNPNLYVLALCSRCGFSQTANGNETFTMVSKSDSPSQLLSKIHAIHKSVQESTGPDLQ